MEQKLKKFKLKDLIASDKKSTQYFSNLRWNGKRLCPRCGYTKLYYYNSNKYGCQKCRYNFGEFTRTYLGKLKIKPSIRAHLLHLFVEEQPAYTIRQHMKYDISTIERTFRLFRKAIYDKSLQQIHQQLKLFKELGIDEGILNNHRRDDQYLEYKKEDIDGNEYIIFAIYEMNRFVTAFPILDIEERVFNKLKKQLRENKEFNYFNNHGSFYKNNDNDHIAYAVLDMEKRKVVAYSDVLRGKEDIYIGLEGFWSYVEKWLYHYRGVPKQYFHLYLKEIEFRFNNRNKKIFHELSKLLVEPIPTIDR